MFRVKTFGVAALLALCAFSAMASNFRMADQVYVPIAGRAVGGGGAVQFVTDLFVSNPSTTDSVTVSVIYAPLGANPAIQNFSNLFTLAPRERREFADFFNTAISGGGLGLSVAFGQLIFNGCRANSDCAPDPTTGENANFRIISIESRIYSFPTTVAQAIAPTNGQLFSGLPWYSFVSSDVASIGLGNVFVTGLRNTGGAGTAGTFRSTIGLVNASQFSTTTLLVKLFDGRTGNQIGATASVTLGPLGTSLPGAAALFPTFTGPTATNAWITVEQTNTIPTGDASANGCPSGCPAFFAFGSVLDNATSDPTTLEPQYEKALNSTQLACIYNPTQATCKSAPTIRRAAKSKL